MTKNEDELSAAEYVKRTTQCKTLIEAENLIKRAMSVGIEWDKVDWDQLQGDDLSYHDRLARLEEMIGDTGMDDRKHVRALEAEFDAGARDAIRESGHGGFINNCAHVLVKEVGAEAPTTKWKSESNNLSDFLLKKAEYREYLSKIVQFEESHRHDVRVLHSARSLTGDKKADSAWRWNDVAVQPTHIAQLITHGAVRKLHASKLGTFYCLVDRAEVKQVLSGSARGPSIPEIKSVIACNELRKLVELEGEFNDYLQRLVGDEARMKRVIEFGKEFDINEMMRILCNMFSPLLAADIILAIVQQYALANSNMTNANGTVSGQTGFNLALFGQSGSGKTFAIDDIIRGNHKRGVPAVGLPGLNRYCGGMSPAKFIRLGEAYQGRRFNFIVTEFNSWFKYEGMVEPLKLAMEQGEVLLELKNETVGPYRFDSFFSVNYNTSVSADGYKVTVSDPNFAAIEDRTLCRLHQLTKERLQALWESQRALRQGEIDFGIFPLIRDHLALVYAIQSGHPLVPSDLKVQKPVLVGADIEEALTEINDEFLRGLDESNLVAFSARLTERAVKVAAASSLVGYFRHDGPELLVQLPEIEYAMAFYKEEMEIRSGEKKRRRL